MLINDQLFLLKEIPKMHPGSLEYVDWWREQKKRCIEGYWVGGKYMPGNLYFYVNFWTILLNKSEHSKTKTPGKPLLRDLEWEFFYNWVQARGLSGFTQQPRADNIRDVLRNPNKDLGRPIYENEAKNLFMMGSRGFGKSYGVSGGVVGHEFLFDGLKEYNPGPEGILSSTEIVVGAGDAKYSGDILKKVDFGLSQLPGSIEINGKFYPCPFSKQYSGSWASGKEVIASYKKKVGGTWKQYGTNSKIKHRTFKDNEFAANGTRPAVMVMEEIGMFDNLKAAHEASVECMKNGTYKFGSCMYLGTGGDMEGGTQDASEMFYDPDTFDMLAFLDEWEDRGKIGYFVPATKGLNQYKDANGNTDDAKALEFLVNYRENLRKGKNAHSALDSELQNRPIKPSEMFLRKSGNIFPRVELGEWLGKLESSGKYKDAALIGDLYYEEGNKVKWRPNDSLQPVMEFPLKKDADKEGCVVIWEHPYIDSTGNTPFGLYIAGCDPIDQDDASSSPSLGSVFIYKTFISANVTYNIPVAEYTGRPNRADEFYEHVRKLLLYYNAKCLYENQLKGLKAYFETKKCLHLLKEQPGIIADIVKDSKVNRGYGIHMTEQIKSQCEIYLRDWLIQERTDIDGTPIMNLHEIYSIPLLKELIAYNRDDNFDRVISFMLCILHQIDNHKVTVEKTRASTTADKFFKTDIYSRANRFAF